MEQPGLDDLSSAKGENDIAFLNWMDAEWGSDMVQNVNCYEHVEGRVWSGVERWLIKGCGFGGNELQKIRKDFILFEDIWNCPINQDNVLKM